MQAIGPAGMKLKQKSQAVKTKTKQLGFYNVPVTKFLVLFVGTCSILSAILNLKMYFHLQLTPHLTIHHQVRV